MNGIIRPCILLFIVICAVAMVWSSGGDSKQGNKAFSVRSKTYDNPQERRKVLKRFRGISSLRRIQRARRHEMSTYKVCIEICETSGAGADGNVRLNIITTNGQSWDEPVTMVPNEDFESGGCYCFEFEKPKLTSVLQYKVRVGLEADEEDEMKPYRFFVQVPGQISMCDFMDDCDFWTESCWLSVEEDKTVNTCWSIHWIPQCGQ